MDKKFIIALMVAFIAMKNPVVDLSSAGKVFASPAKIKTANALSEADIASNIESLYRGATPQTIEQKAKIQSKKYNKLSANAIQQVQVISDYDSAGEKLRKAGLRATYAPIYVQAAKAYHMPWEIIAAVHRVETHQSGDTAVTSYAGAQGPMQFMPSTFSAYAVDGDRDGSKRIGDVGDAIFSAANYMASNGAASGNVITALYRYNHDYSYVYYVLSIARSLGYNK